MSELPTIDELALGAFLHDAGKLLQRGLGATSALPEPVRALEGELCPAFQGRYSHKHVLFTEHLFHELAAARLALPGGLDRERVRVAAVYHHNPDPRRPWTWLVAEADRLSSGMDRKEKDRERETGEEARGWDAFRRQPLLSILSQVRLQDRPEPKALWLRPREADPEAIVGEAQVSRDGLPGDYAATADAFLKAFVDLCHVRQPAALLHEGAIGLAERFWWAVPSSTVDEPDVPLLDHSLSVAAFAACLHAHHAERGELEDERAIKDRERPKFRLLRGDLSGIQSSLFRLAAQQVKGANRILRARSFLMGQLVEAAALLVREAFGLPPYTVLLRAGGQLTMLLPEVEGVPERVAELQARIDGWMARAYAGELSLVLGLTGPLAGVDFGRDRIEATLRTLAAATERAKQQALGSFLAANGPVLGLDYEEGAEGACGACGVRPAKEACTDEHGERRCFICHHEHAIGRKLPKLGQCFLLKGEAEEGLVLLDAVRLRIVEEGERAFTPGANLLSGWRPRGGTATWPVADRWIANHVPTFAYDPEQDPRYRGLADEPKETYEASDLKTMAHLAADARDVLEGGEVVGRAMLAVLKADVDNLGQVFGSGLGRDRSIGRLVALSRAMDAFFTGRLPWLLEKRFPDTYTVYAGGDDLLLIGPWRQILELAASLRAEFGAYTGHNPSLTLSAGIELVDAREPLNRSARRAEERLEAAKAVPGKDRVGCLGEVLDWERGLPWVLARAEALSDRMRAGDVPRGFLYQLLHFAEEKRRADAGDSLAAIWRARYSYALARRYPKRDEHAREAPFFHELLGLMPDGAKGGPAPPTRAALSVAIWRNR